MPGNQPEEYYWSLTNSMVIGEYSVLSLTFMITAAQSVTENLRSNSRRLSSLGIIFLGLKRNFFNKNLTP